MPCIILRVFPLSRILADGDSHNSDAAELRGSRNAKPSGSAWRGPSEAASLDDVRRHSPKFAATVASHSRRATAHSVCVCAFATVIAATRQAHGVPLALSQHAVQPQRNRFFQRKNSGLVQIDGIRA